jgi:hypothetical protein
MEQGEAEQERAKGRDGSQFVAEHRRVHPQRRAGALHHRPEVVAFVAKQDRQPDYAFMADDANLNGIAVLQVGEHGRVAGFDEMDGSDRLVPGRRGSCEGASRRLHVSPGDGLGLRAAKPQAGDCAGVAGRHWRPMRLPLAFGRT